MCRRFDQNDIARALSDFSWIEEYLNRSQAEPKFNVAPGTYRPVMHVEGAALLLDDRHWGYRSGWGKEKKIPVAVNARLEKITNAYWKPLLKRGKCIVPANGWYEWTGEKGSKQPWHIHRRDREPLYMAGLAVFGPDTDHKAGTGFVIVTADAQGGMVDVHDRRAVVLTAADAATWLDPELSGEQAADLARSVALGPEMFEWHRVDRAVGKVGSQGAHLAEELDNQGP